MTTMANGQPVVMVEDNEEVSGNLTGMLAKAGVTTDDNPTVMALLGLHDDYQPQGRVLEELFTPATRSKALSVSRAFGDYVALAQVFSQLQSPVGELGLLSLQIATQGISGNDSAHAATDASLGSIQQQRDRLALEMLHILDGAAFSGDAVAHVRVARLEAVGERLIDCASVEATNPSHMC
jgi:hypothetical protein